MHSCFLLCPFRSRSRSQSCAVCVSHKTQCSWYDYVPIHASDRFRGEELGDAPPGPISFFLMRFLGEKWPNNRFASVREIVDTPLQIKVPWTGLPRFLLNVWINFWTLCHIQCNIACSSTKDEERTLYSLQVIQMCVQIFGMDLFFGEIRVSMLKSRYLARSHQERIDPAMDIWPACLALHAGLQYAVQICGPRISRNNVQLLSPGKCTRRQVSSGNVRLCATKCKTNIISYMWMSLLELFCVWPVIRDILCFSLDLVNQMGCCWFLGGMIMIASSAQV